MVGLPRCGSTLLESKLASRHGVTALGEDSSLLRAAHALPGGWPKGAAEDAARRMVVHPTTFVDKKTSSTTWCCPSSCTCCPTPANQAPERSCCRASSVCPHGCTRGPLHPTGSPNTRRYTTTSCPIGRTKCPKNNGSKSLTAMVQDMDATLHTVGQFAGINVEQQKSTDDIHPSPSPSVTNSWVRSAPIAPVTGNATKRGSLVDDLVGPFALSSRTNHPRFLVLGETKSVEVLVRKLRRGVVGPVTQDGGSSGDAAARLSGFRMLRERIGGSWAAQLRRSLLRSHHPQCTGRRRWAWLYVTRLRTAGSRCILQNRRHKRWTRRVPPRADLLGSFRPKSGLAISSRPNITASQRPEAYAALASSTVMPPPATYRRLAVLTIKSLPKSGADGIESRLALSDHKAFHHIEVVQVSFGQGVGKAP